MKQTILLFSLFIFILCSAMSCEDYPEDYDDNENTINCNLTDIKLHHINNEGSTPHGTDEKVKKEAYMIGIELITDKEEPFLPPVDSYVTYKLNDGITRINIICESIFNQDIQAGQDITGYFQEYPLCLPYKIEDCTLRGDTIYDAENSRIYKVLTTYPDAGIFTFKTIITLAGGTTIEKSTSPIELY